MGSIAAMNSIHRVIQNHGDEIKATCLEDVPHSIRQMIQTVELSNEVYRIDISYRLVDGGTLPGPALDIDTLAEDYPDCEVSY